MGLFGLFKKKKSDKAVVMDSREIVNANAQSVEVLLVLANGKEELVSELKSLQEKLKYLSPSKEEKVQAIDGKIKNLLGDLKIELTKTKGQEGSGKAGKYLEDVRLLVAERSVYTNR